MPRRAGASRVARSPSSTAKTRTRRTPLVLLRRLVLRPFRSAIAGFCALLALLCTERHAAAFERQWHLGAGLGGLTTHGYHLGPAINAYAAYGISDVFDVRLEAAASRNVFETTFLYDARTRRAGHRDGEPSLLYGAKLAVVYKIDVIEWIPYAGPSAGFLGVTAPQGRFEAITPTVGGLVGLDYAMSRDLGFGIAGSYDYAIIGRGSVISAFLRAEYHFGY